MHHFIPPCDEIDEEIPQKTKTNNLPNGQVEEYSRSLLPLMSDNKTGQVLNREETNRPGAQNRSIVDFHPPIDHSDFSSVEDSPELMQQVYPPYTASCPCRVSMFPPNIPDGTSLQSVDSTLKEASPGWIRKIDYSGSKLHLRSLTPQDSLGSQNFENLNDCYGNSLSSVLANDLLCDKVVEPSDTGSSLHSSDQELEMDRMNKECDWSI